MPAREAPVTSPTSFDTRSNPESESDLGTDSIAAAESDSGADAETLEEEIVSETIEDKSEELASLSDSLEVKFEVPVLLEDELS